METDRNPFLAVTEIQSLAVQQMRMPMLFYASFLAFPEKARRSSSHIRLLARIPPSAKQVHARVSLR
jgi:hypothetical protein